MLTWGMLKTNILYFQHMHIHIYTKLPFVITQIFCMDHSSHFCITDIVANMTRTIRKTNLINGVETSATLNVEYWRNIINLSLIPPVKGFEVQIINCYAFCIFGDPGSLCKNLLRNLEEESVRIQSSQYLILNSRENIVCFLSVRANIL